MSETTHDMQTVLDAIKGEGQWASPGKLSTSAGNIAVVARRLGVHSMTVRNYMKRWVTVADAIREERRALVDMAENKALEKILEGDTAMIIFTLKAHPESRTRGWSEKSQVEHSGEVIVKGYGIVSPDDWDRADNES